MLGKRTRDGRQTLSPTSAPALPVDGNAIETSADPTGRQWRALLLTRDNGNDDKGDLVNGAKRARRQYDSGLVGDHGNGEFDMRALLGGVDRIHLLQACAIPDAVTLSPLIEATIARLVDGAWVQVDYIERTTEPPLTARARLCDILVRIYGSFWSHLARCDAVRMPSVMGCLGNPPTPAQVLRFMKQRMRLAKYAVARVKDTARSDPIGASDTVVALFVRLSAQLTGRSASCLGSIAGPADGPTPQSSPCHPRQTPTTKPTAPAIVIDLDALEITSESSMDGPLNVSSVHIASVEDEVRAEVDAYEHMAKTIWQEQTLNGQATATAMAVTRKSPFAILVLVGAARSLSPDDIPGHSLARRKSHSAPSAMQRSGAPRTNTTSERGSPMSAAGATYEMTTRYALAAVPALSSQTKRGHGQVAYSWVAWCMWDSRTRRTWEDGNADGIAAAEHRIGAGQGAFVQWMRAVAVNAGIALPSGVLVRDPPTDCLNASQLMHEVPDHLVRLFDGYDRRQRAWVHNAILHSRSWWAPITAHQAEPLVTACRHVHPLVPLEIPPIT